MVMCADSRAECCAFKPRVWPQLDNFPCSPSSKWVPVGTKVCDMGIIIIAYSVKRFEIEIMMKRYINAIIIIVGRACIVVELMT